MTLKVGLLTLRQILINLTKTQLRHDIATEGAHQVGPLPTSIGPIRIFREDDFLAARAPASAGVLS